MATARMMARDAKELPPIELGLGDYLKWAVDRNRENLQVQARKGLFQSPLFEFVRCAKAHPDLANLSASEAFDAVQEIPWRLAFPESGDPEMEFLATWDKVRVPFGKHILHLAASLASDKPLQPKNCISQGYARYLSIAARLQELRPGDYIMLPVRDMGDLLGVEPRTISYYNARAVKDG